MEIPSNTSRKFKLNVDILTDAVRLDKFVADKLGAEFSRKQLQSLIQNHGINVDGVVTHKRNFQLKKHSELEIIIPEGALVSPRNSSLAAVPMNLDIIYEDADLAVLNKAAGIAVHPGAGERNPTLVNGLLHHYGAQFSEANEASLLSERPGIVHRLDKDTSGLIIVAKHDIAHRLLSQMIEQRLISRHYLALVFGKPSQLVGVVRSGIRKSSQDHTRMQVSNAPEAKQAVTHYRIVQGYDSGLATLLECRLETGRTHQIRLHMEYLKHPIVGDAKYGKGMRGAALSEVKVMGGGGGGDSFAVASDVLGDSLYFAGDSENSKRSLARALLSFPRQALHAWQLVFTHPISGKPLNFTVSPPHDMQLLLDSLGSVSS